MVQEKDGKGEDAFHLIGYICNNGKVFERDGAGILEGQERAACEGRDGGAGEANQRFLLELMQTCKHARRIRMSHDGCTEKTAENTST